MLTAEQIELVQDSFARVVSRSDAVAVLFYEKLFEVRPDYRDLFPQDMTEQRAKLMTTLASVVQSLSDIEGLLPAVEDLGRRHVNYNVQAYDYGPVGEALIATLEIGLGDAFTEEVSGAWRTAYALLAKTMIDAAREAASSAA